MNCHTHAFQYEEKYRKFESSESVVSSRYMNKDHETSNSIRKGNFFTRANIYYVLCLHVQ